MQQQVAFIILWRTLIVALTRMSVHKNGCASVKMEGMTVLVPSFEASSQ